MHMHILFSLFIFFNVSQGEELAFGCQDGLKNTNGNNITAYNNEQVLLLCESGCLGRWVLLLRALKETIQTRLAGGQHLIRPLQAEICNNNSNNLLLLCVCASAASSGPLVLQDVSGRPLRPRSCLRLDKLKKSIFSEAW